MLQRQNVVPDVYTRYVTGGADWSHEIDANLKGASIVLLLISPDFMSSGYSSGLEMQLLLEEYHNGDICVLPIILRPTYWESAPFSKIPVLPMGGRPITGWSNTDEAFLDVMQGIHQAVEAFQTPKRFKDRGYALYKAEHFNEALVAYEHAIRVDPNDGDAYMGKSLSLFYLNHQEEALAAYEKALSLSTPHRKMPSSKIINIEQQLQEIKQNIVPADELRRSLDRLNEWQKFLRYGQMRSWNLEQQKLKAPCPSIFVLRQELGTPIHPKNWISRSYRLHLLCQYPGEPHTIQGEKGYEIHKGKEWWNTISPWLHCLVDVLKVGAPMGKALGEVFDKVDIDRFASDIDLLNEILTDLPVISPIEAVKETGLDSQRQEQQRLEGSALQALHAFLEKQKRPWQGLSQVITSDGTILWLCDRHRREYEFPPVRGISFP